MTRGVVISDTHCGHRAGLTPPGFWNQDSFAWHRPFWDWFKAFAEKAGPLDFLIGNGDLVDGPGKKETTQHLTTDLRRQVQMAVEILKLFDAKKTYIVRGTGFHVDSGCSLEDFVADALGCPVSDDLRLQIEGRLLHVRHVISRSDIPYGQYTPIGKAVVAEMMQAEMEGYRAADSIIRSHVHYCTEVAIADGARGIVRKGTTTPCLQLRLKDGGPFVRKLPTWLYHVGALIVEIEDSEIFFRPFIFPIASYGKSQRRYISDGTG